MIIDLGGDIHILSGDDLETIKEEDCDGEKSVVMSAMLFSIKIPAIGVGTSVCSVLYS